MRDSKGRFIKGVHSSLNSEFKKGHIPSNKNRLNKVCLICNIVFTVNLARFDKTKFCSKKCGYLGRKTLRGEQKLLWKGDLVSYRGLHYWVERHKGKPIKCEFCWKEKTTSKSIQWANISHTYQRDLNDWISLCVSCHRIFDNEWRRSQLT